MRLDGVKQMVHDDRHVGRPRPRRPAPRALRAGHRRRRARVADPGADRATGRPQRAGRPEGGGCAISIGIHVESLDDAVRLKWMPGKGSVPLAEYRAAWAEAVRVFGRNQVSTYLIVGLGEDPDELVAGAAELDRAGCLPVRRPVPAHRRHARRRRRSRDRPPSWLVADVTSRIGELLAEPACRVTTRRPAARPAVPAARCRRPAADPCRSRCAGDGADRPAGRSPRRARGRWTIAADARDLAAYRALRRDVFVDEQGLFAGTTPTTSTTTRARWCSSPARSTGSVLGGVRLAPAIPNPTSAGGRAAGWSSARTLGARAGSVSRRSCGPPARTPNAWARCASRPPCRAPNEPLFTRLGWDHRSARSPSPGNHTCACAGRSTGRQRQARSTKAALGDPCWPACTSAVPGFVGDDGVPVPGSDLVAACDAIVPSTGRARPRVGRLVRGARQRQRPVRDGRGAGRAARRHRRARRVVRRPRAWPACATPARPGASRCSAATPSSGCPPR